MQETDVKVIVAVANAVDLWDTVRGWCGNTIKDMTREELLYRIGPERSTPWWLFGHITITSDIARYLDSTVSATFPKEWLLLFDRKTKPTDTGDGYPDKETLMAQFHTAMDSNIATIQRMSDTSFSEVPATPLPEPLDKYFLNRREVINGFATHASYHAGQLAIIRKMLGR